MKVGDKFVCIGDENIGDDKIYYYADYRFTVGKTYTIDERILNDGFYVVDDNKFCCYYLPKGCFITLSEYRNNKINSILE